MSQAQIEIEQDSADNQERIYDASPYESYSYYKTHPDHLYLLGRLYSLNPPDYRTARVLELGCAGGGNLAPYAFLYPDSKCLGIDISGEEIRQANLLKEKLGLKNAGFVKRNIMDVSAKADGEFDYIICHGLLAWVPAPVREKILEICASQLSENGMAVISYNALPGWNAIRSLREMMIYEVRGCTDLKEKAKKARNLLSFLARNVPPKNAAHHAILQNEDTILSQTFDDFILHDHLGEFNEPLYLHQFAEKLEKHGLQYLCDSELAAQYTRTFSEEAQAKVAKIQDRIKRFQMIDFLTNRRFHTSVIVRAGQKINDRHDRDFIFENYVTLNAAPENETPDPSGAVKFIKHQSPQENITIDNGYLRDILLEMHYQGLHPMKMDGIIDLAMKSAGTGDREPYRDAIRSAGLDLILSGYLQLYTEPALTINYVSEKPCVHPLMRAVVELHPATPKVINPYRGTADTEKFINLLISCCDGTRTPEEINEKMMERIKSGEVKLSDRNGLPVTDPVQQKLLLESATFTALNNLAGGGALIS